MKNIFLFATFLLLMVKFSISQDIQDSLSWYTLQDGMFCYTHDRRMVCGANEDGHYVPSVYKICFPKEPIDIYSWCEEQIFMYPGNTIIIISQNYLDWPDEVEPFLKELLSEMEEGNVSIDILLIKKLWDKKDYAIIKIEEFMMILLNVGTENKKDLLNIISSFKIISHKTIRPWGESIDTLQQKKLQSQTKRK